MHFVELKSSIPPYRFSPLPGTCLTLVYVSLLTAPLALSGQGACSGIGRYNTSSDAHIL